MNETKITEYSQVPWFRRNGFVFLAWVLCWPVAVAIFWTGEVYYRRGGQLKTYGKGAKIALTVIAAGLTMGYINDRREQGGIERAAVAVVNQIVQDRLGVGAPECTGVKLDGGATDGVYHGTATFATGDQVPITVERMGGQIQVTIDPGQ